EREDRKGVARAKKYGKARSERPGEAETGRGRLGESHEGAQSYLVILAVAVAARPRRPLGECRRIVAVADLAPFGVALGFVLLHDRSRRDFLGAPAVATRLLGGLFDVLVLAPLFRANPA